MEKIREADQEVYEMPKHGYRFGTQKFENRKITYRTSGVFNGNGSAKRDRGSIKMS
jgi:hypothetical protein